MLRYMLLLWYAVFTRTIRRKVSKFDDVRPVVESFSEEWVGYPQDDLWTVCVCVCVCVWGGGGGGGGGG